MRVALLGNMNNMLYQVARYLTDANHDCTLFLFEEFDHFLPYADNYSEQNTVEIIQTNWTKEDFDIISPKEIRKLSDGYDFYIGTDIAPAFFFKAGLKLDIFYPHGSDLYEFPFPPFVNKRLQQWELKNYFFGKHQFYGIQEAVCIALDPSEEVYEQPLLSIKGNSFNRILSAPFLYSPQYEDGFERQSQSLNEFKALRLNYDLIIWQHISQDWSDRGHYKINKGNDILIKGFSDYLNKAVNKEKCLLILLEYGGDVQKSKDYITNLGISENVKWIPKMLRKDIMAALTQVDFGVGELGYRRWYSYSSIFEYLQAGLPGIHHRDDLFYQAKGFDLYPMIDADNTEDIAKAFKDFESNKDKYKEMGKSARVWVENYFRKSIEGFINQIKNKTGDNQVENFAIKNRKMRLDLMYMKYTKMNQFYNLKQSIKSILRNNSN
jgi:glycosyltransferase involved in cell wall biosynthesis